MDHKRCHIINRGLLKVDDHQLTAARDAAERHVAGRCNSHARAHAEDQIRQGALDKAKLEDLLFEVFTEIDDCIFELTVASWSVTDSASLVVVALLSSSNTVVSHVLTVALHADLQVSISVHISKLGWVDSTLSVEAVDVLADHSLEDSSVHEFNESHVSGRRLGLLDGNVEGDAVGVGERLVGSLHVVLELLLAGGFLPAARASLKNCAIARSVVRDSTRCRDASARESGEVVALLDPLCKLADLVV